MIEWRVSNIKLTSNNLNVKLIFMLDKDLTQTTVQYLSQVLGEKALRVVPTKRATELPYFLQDLYTVLEAEFHGQAFTIACTKGSQSMAAQQSSQHAARLGEILGTPVIIALPEITPGQRKQFIRHDVAFVVPNKQLFAPKIGLILTERFGGATRPAQVIASPATQGLLVWFLNQRPTAQVWHPFEAAASLGYAGMTATRAIRELVQFKLFELEIKGRAKHLLLQGTRRDLWEKAKPHLRTPVLRTMWTYDQRILKTGDFLWAGESALAHLSLLNEPLQPTIAMTAQAVQKAKSAGIFFEPRELADGIAVQVWRYGPNLNLPEKTVDPLSLWLSLSDHPNDRIQIALDSVEEDFQW